MDAISAEGLDMGKRMLKCLVCGAVFEEGTEVCPVCGVGPENFEPVEAANSEFAKDTEEKFLILGGGPAGRSAAAAVRERNKKAVITIITMEDELPYNRPMLTKALLDDHSGDALAIEGADWYEKNRIFVMKGTRVLSIDTSAKEVKVELSDGSMGLAVYDKLIYALGAYCFVAPIKGSELEHVVTVRNIADTVRIREIVKDRDVKNLVCIGGGVMGLEAASTMNERGFNVTVLQNSSGLLPRQLDDVAATILQKTAESKGVKIVTNAKISEINGNAVVLEDGSSYPAELVIMTTGMRPYTQLAEEAGIEVDKWVVADDHMRTSAGSVYAAGDCVVFNGQPQAFWAQAEATGRIAGANAAGDDLIYEPIGSALVMHAFGTAVFALGTNGKEPDRAFRCESDIDEIAGTYSARYYAEDTGKMAGAILIGDLSAMPELTKEIGV